MAELVAIKGDLGDLLDRFDEEGWTDGLPVLPPTEAAVESMLRYADRDPDDVAGALPPNRADATIRGIAINAVMAGCRPEYLPVVIAAIEAIAMPEFNLYGIQATTNPVATMIVVNGPLARELKFNGKGNCFGPGNRANATVGRAVRLCMQNIGGGVSQTMDKSTHGQPGKYSMCIAENEDENPWEPYHVERGFDAATSTVTAFSVTGTTNVLDLASKQATGILRTFASACAHVGAQNVQLGGGPLIIFCPEHAAILAQDGFSKAEVKRFLYETSRVKIQDFPPETLNGMVRHRRPKRYGSEHPEATIPLADGPEEIEILVAGGPGPHSVFLPSFGEATCSSIKPILHRDGSPVRSVRDFV
ncbi:MAG: hypothetical protein KGJ86_11535 [Chloroflexota bacterium]|nr:hypothetical protein [Chloroflexota bacterium]